MQFYHIQPKCFAKEIPDSFGGKGYKTNYVVSKTFLLIYTILPLSGKLLSKVKAIATQKVTYHFMLLWS